MSDKNQETTNGTNNEKDQTKANTQDNSVNEFLNSPITNNNNADTNLNVPSCYSNIQKENLSTNLNEHTSDIEKPLLENQNQISNENMNNIYTNKPEDLPIIDLQGNNIKNDEFEYEKIKQQNFRIVDNNFICNSNINPISQYNYFISICNISFCKSQNGKFWKVPFCNCLGALFDLYITLIQKLTNFVGCLCSKGCKWMTKIPTEEAYVVVNHVGQRRYFTEGSCDIFYLIGTLIIFCVIFWVYFYALLILLLPHLFFTLYNFIALLIHLRNKNYSKQKSSFFDYMLFDENMLDDPLDQCLCVSDKQQIDNFKHLTFYENLKVLYNMRNDESKAQKFIVYGPNFRNLYSGLCHYFLYQMILTIVITGTIVLFNYLVGTRSSQA